MESTKGPKKRKSVTSPIDAEADDWDFESSNHSKYRAPALEKGLDILQLLVSEGKPLTMTEICARLKRSQGEIFRMVQVLQGRGFLEQDSATDGYFLTDLLFSMAMRQPPTQTTVEVALPKMRGLASDIGQSCHLAMYARGEIVVVARMESNERIGFSVRVGHRRSIVQSVSGLVLFAFQPPDIQTLWLRSVSAATERGDLEDFVANAEGVRAAGYARAPSSFVHGVTDISVPIMRGDRAAAALTIPFIEHANMRFSVDAALDALIKSAAEISAHLIESDNRV